MAKDPFNEGFKKGEAYGMATITNIVKGLENEFPRGSMPIEQIRKAVSQYFAGFSAAMMSSMLVASHQTLEGMLKTCKENPAEADLWAQKVFTLFVDALHEAKVPVECQFMIRRKEK